MDNLSFLEELQARRGENVNLTRLVHLPATVDIEVALARSEARLRTVLDNDLRGVYPGLAETREREVARLQEQLELARQRDGLDERRPEGCWCLGEGGRNPCWLDDYTVTFREYCVCPEATAVKEQAAVARAWLTEHREEVKRSRLVRDADIPLRFQDYSFDSFPATEHHQFLIEQLLAWAEEVDDSSSLFLWGDFGVGKTGLAVATLKATIMKVAVDGLFVSVPELLNDIRATYSKESTTDEHSLVDTVKSAGLVLLDDIGAERPTEWVREKLFTIINHRHSNESSTIFTSNLSIKELADHIGERTTWRIVEMCGDDGLIHIEGPNLRLSQKRSSHEREEPARE